jgi:hypothetical protein
LLSAQLLVLDPSLTLSNVTTRIDLSRKEHIERLIEGLRRAGVPE